MVVFVRLDIERVQTSSWTLPCLTGTYMPPEDGPRGQEQWDEFMDTFLFILNGYVGILR
jgi:hypothetical protein